MTASAATIEETYVQRYPQSRALWERAVKLVSAAGFAGRNTEARPGKKTVRRSRRRTARPRKREFKGRSAR